MGGGDLAGPHAGAHVGEGAQGDMLGEGLYDHGGLDGHLEDLGHGEERGVVLGQGGPWGRAPSASWGGGHAPHGSCDQTEKLKL